MPERFWESPVLSLMINNMFVLPYAFRLFLITCHAVIKATAYK